MKAIGGRRLLGVVTALVLLLGMMPRMSREVKAASITCLISIENSTDNFTVDSSASGVTGGSATYDKTTHTLTLNNFNYISDVYEAVIVSHLNSLNIVLVGNSSLTNTSENSNSRGIVSFSENSTLVYGVVTISSENNGTLTLKTASAQSSVGIAAGHFILNSGTVNIETGTGTVSSLALITMNGNVNVGGGTLICSAGESNNSYGIMAGENGKSIIYIGPDARVEASGYKRALNGFAKNSFPGTGWSNAAGTEGETAIAKNLSGAKLDFKKVKFLKPEELEPEENKSEETKPVYPDLTPSSDFSTSLNLSTNSVVMQEDQTAVVTVPVGTKATVKSNKSKVAKVKYDKKKGTITITGKEAGAADITVKAKTATEHIRVEVKPTEFDVNPTTLTLNYKEKQTINTGVKNKKLDIRYNKKIVSAKLNKSKGTITIEGKAKGTDTVKVTYGGVTKEINVNVTATTKMLKLSKKNVTFKKPDKSVNVGITATPKLAITGELPQVTVDNTSVATAEYVAKTNKIKVTPVASGTTDMTVTVGTKSVTIPVTVK